MGLGDDIGALLQQYTGGNNGQTQAGDRVEQDFDQVSRQAPQEDLSHGLSEAFRSDQTPPFPQMVGQLFGQSDGTQRAGMLNQMLGGMGPSVLGSLLGGGALGGLGSLLQRGGNQGQPATITPEQAQQMRPEEVEQIAHHAQQANPSIIDHVSGFYAQHPNVVKALGGVALSIALGKMAQRRQG